LSKAAPLRSYALLTTKVSVKVKFREHASFKAESKLSATDDTRTLGIVLFGESTSVLKLVSLCLIFAGIIGLKLAHP
jgi:NADH:ubiquinone oxidoreductase subunit 6 (subunit J)